MMLATRCPYCHTTFRVVQDQLKICNGIVRCGTCRQVFNGIEQLQSADAAANAARAQAQNEVAWPESAVANSNPVTIVVEDDAKSDFTEAHDDLNLVLTPAEECFQNTSPLADTPDPFFAEETETGAMAQEAEEPQPDLMLHFDDRKEPRLADELTVDAHSARDLSKGTTFESTQLPAAMMVATQSPLHVVDDDEDPAYKVELRTKSIEPAFVQRARRQERFGRIARILTALLILGLLPALFLQTVDAFHQRIGATFPAAKPMLAQVCDVIRCQSELPSQIDAVSVDSSELHAPAGSEKAFVLNVLLRNRSPLAQAWPYIELTLNDSDEKPVVRRVFNAAEYLNGAQEAAKGLAAHSEQSLKLVFEVEQPLKPVGYRVYVFYP